MRLLVLALFLGLFMACTMKKQQQSEKSYSFYVGSYTWKESEGIYRYKLNANGTLDSIALVAKSESPSFLALSADKKFLIAGNEVKKENGEGTVEAYAINGETLSLTDVHPSGGAHTCYVDINKAGQTIVANYTGGNVALLQLDKTGKFTDVFDVKQHEGKGTTERQEAPHAHSIWFVPNTNQAIAADLGTNELWFYTIDSENGKLIPQNQAKIAMAEGAGPRHLTFHPNGKWIYVLNELNNTVSRVEKNTKGIYQITQSISSLPDDFKNFSKAADIHISPDGKFLYASNRGHNSLVIYSVEAETGILKVVGYESVKGDHPRNFSITDDGKYLIVANQNTNNIVSFKRNPETGLLTFVDEIYASLPVCVLFE